MTSHTPGAPQLPTPVEATVNGRYRLTAWLGRTVLADEYLAHDLHLDRSVVFKALLPTLVADRGFLDRFRAQAQATANLNHPAIAAVLDWGRDQGAIPDGTGAWRPGPTYYMVSEHVAGRSLTELVSVNGPMPPERVAHVIIGTTAALGFAHRAGIVDGGLNPDKIRVSSTGVVKVVDLGLLRSLGTGWIPTDATPAQWMAPEQFRGDAPSERTDVYQVGLIAYFLATGKAPYSGDTVEDLRKGHQESVPIAPTKASPLVPKALESFIGRSMAKSPDDRYSSITEQRGSIVRLRDRLTGSVSLNRRLAAPTTPDTDATAVLTTTAGAAALAALGVSLETAVPPVMPTVRPAPTPTPTRQANESEVRASSYSAATYDSVTYDSVTDDDADHTVAHLASDGDTDEFPEYGEAAPYDPDNTSDRSDADATKVQKKPRRTASTGAIKANAKLPSGPDRDFAALDKKSPRRGLYALTLLTLLAILGSLLFLLAKQLGVTGTTTGSVEVPAVEQRPIDEAKRILSDLGLRVETERVTSGSVAADIVVKQTPSAAARVTEGAVITLQVSTGSTKPTVPKVVGLTVFQAQSQLAQFGLTWEIREKKDDVAEAGTVVSQEPRAESEVTPGAVVILDVAVSSTKKQVPKVDGKSVEEARVELTREGFLIVVQSEPSNGVEKGTVIRTEPGSGTSVAKGSSVLIVASGGKAITVPVVIGKDENSAREALQALGLIVVVKQRAESDVSKVGKVVSQTPDTGDVEVGATVTIRVGVEGEVATTAKPVADGADGSPEPTPVEPDAAPLQTVATAAPTTAAPIAAEPAPPATTTAPAPPAGPVPAAAATSTAPGTTIAVVTAVTPTSTPA
jgi:eukaryotic-like serine/threonine-protein kinase